MKIFAQAEIQKHTTIGFFLIRTPNAAKTGLNLLPLKFNASICRSISLCRMSGVKTELYNTWM